jgi:uncharacterized protein
MPNAECRMPNAECRMPIRRREITVIDKQLLDILVCPETKEPVSLADEDFVARINEKIKTGELTNRGGEKVTEPISGCLIRQDRQYMYMIREDIPIMLIDQAIPLADLTED